MKRLSSAGLLTNHLRAVARLSWLACSLLALNAVEEDSGYDWTELGLFQGGVTGFTLLDPEETQVEFVNLLDEWSAAANRTLINGSGVALGDIDNDGWPDIYFCGLQNENRLFRNLGGWRFEDVTQAAGVACPGQFSRGAVFADLNGDGSLDLLVSGLGRGLRCFINNGKGQFAETTRSSGLASRLGSTTTTLADVDGNGTLDIYVANNRSEDIRDRGQVNLQMVGGRLQIPVPFRDRLLLVDGELRECGEPDQLFLNDGKGKFSLVDWNSGMFLDLQGEPLTKAPLDWGLSATFRDFNGDLAPDLYVCNDYWTPDRFWMNDGNGQFRAVSPLALRHISASSMGVDCADINGDGLLDFFVVDMLSRDPKLRKRQMLAQNPSLSQPGDTLSQPQAMRNTLFVQRPDGTFAEVADLAGVAASDWSWSPVFVDVDLDGYEDLLITAGHPMDVQDLDAAAAVRARPAVRDPSASPLEQQRAFTEQLMLNNRLYPPLKMPIVAFRNLGNLHFEETTSLWGTDDLGVHHGIGLADLDRDGDLDLVVNNLGQPAGVYRNNAAAPRLAVRLRGLAANSRGIGALVELRDGPVRQQSGEVVCGGRYLSGSDTLLTFAASLNRPMQLRVRWRSGATSVIPDVQANRVYEIDEPVVSEQVLSKPSRGLEQIDAVERSPFFSNVSELINHRHHESNFDDFEHQPLLPFMLSRSGPGLGWHDLNDDGFDDLVIGAGQGGAVGILLSDGRGGFSSVGNATRLSVPDDTTGLVASRVVGVGGVLLGSASYEKPGASNLLRVRAGDVAQNRSSEQGRAGWQLVPASVSRVGAPASALALADYDGNGDLDLFVAGGILPGRYPITEPSRLYKLRSGQWMEDPENNGVLREVGLVNAAVWSDLDGDGYPELVLACEWGPIRVFKNGKGVLRETTAALGLAELTGLWKGVTAGDIDGDGNLDLIASNWGLNSPFQATMERPETLYWGDFLRRGVIDLIETEYDPATERLQPRRFLAILGGSMPFVLQRFATHKAYSESSVDSMLGSYLNKAGKLQATTLASTVFLNRGDRFVANPLPLEAQFSPAFGVNCADFNGDGHEDIFLSQNLFAVRADLPRMDAGRGLWLKGNGSGSLVAVSGEESGIKIYGEQRGSALADFNRDGRIDLAVGQNGEDTQLFANIGASPGLRIRLVGPPGNPEGVGVTLRLRSEGKLGAAREVHAGSGYRSQDSAVQVLHARGRPQSVWLRWPGGRTQEVQVQPDRAEVEIRYPLEK